MGYRIGSFNLKNFGDSSLSFNNKRDIQKLAKIIKDNHFDIVALQEVCCEGRAIEGIESDKYKKGLKMELGNDWDAKFEPVGNIDRKFDKLKGKHDSKEYAAFVWNKTRVNLAETVVSSAKRTYVRKSSPLTLSMKAKDIFRKPFYARFTTTGESVLCRSNVEFRLLCIHTYYGDDKPEARNIRLHELDVLLNETLPYVRDKRYGRPEKSYTIMLGDYNAEIYVNGSEKIKNKDGDDAKDRKACILETDMEGFYLKDGKQTTIKTVQNALTSLSRSGDENKPVKLTSNYDHFSYDNDEFESLKVHSKRIKNAVDKYCKIENGDYATPLEKYYYTISDHLPIMLDIDINGKGIEWGYIDERENDD